MSSARFSPMSFGSRYVPPAPGIMASRVSGRPTILVEPKTRRLVDRASSRPPPKAIDDMAEIVGIGRAARLVNVWRSWARNASVLQ